MALPHFLLGTRVLVAAITFAAGWYSSAAAAPKTFTVGEWSGQARYDDSGVFTETDPASINFAMKFVESGDREACQNLKHRRDSTKLPNGVPVSILQTECNNYGNKWVYIYRYFDFGKSILRISTPGSDSKTTSTADNVIFSTIATAASK